MISLSAREMSGLNDSLSLKSLILLRFVSSFGAYFFLSVCTPFFLLAHHSNVHFS